MGQECVQLKVGRGQVGNVNSGLGRHKARLQQVDRHAARNNRVAFVSSGEHLNVDLVLRALADLDLFLIVVGFVDRTLNFGGKFFGVIAAGTDVDANGAGAIVDVNKQEIVAPIDALIGRISLMGGAK